MKLVVQGVPLILMQWSGDEEPKKPCRSSKTEATYNFGLLHPILYVVQGDVGLVMKHYGRDHICIKRSWAEVEDAEDSVPASAG